MTAAAPQTAPPHPPGEATPEHVVIVGASLAGLNAAEELRRQGYSGLITMVGDETHEPYDRPPQSKTIPAGREEPGQDSLPQSPDLNLDWKLGSAATKLDRANRTVTLADGSSIDYDRLLVATGARPRPWHDEQQAALDGVLTVHNREDGEQLRRRLDAGLDRAVIIGAGFTGSELASICRERDIDVTLVERAGHPLQAALGEAVGAVVGTRQRAQGVDLRVGAGVDAITGDDAGRVTSVRLSDGTALDAQLVVVCIGMMRNLEWLDGSGLAVSRDGLQCDGYLRALDDDGNVDEHVFAAGDVAACPRPFFHDTVMALEHWGNAVDQGRYAARSMLGLGLYGADLEVYDQMPRFWSNQLGWNIKSIGVPNAGDTLVITQGLLDLERGVVVYGRQGEICGAVSINAPRELEAYEALIGTPFPPPFVAPDWRGKTPPKPVDARFPDPAKASHDAPATIFDPSRTELAAALGVPDRVPAPAQG